MNTQSTLNEVEALTDEVKALTDEELAAASAGAIYMNFSKIDGHATTNGFRDWIELHSFQ